MTDFSSYQALAASIPGSGHIRRALPCQDASRAILSPRPALIVCDGRGSATHSHDGAHAAIDAFSSQIAVFEPMLAAILDSPDDKSSTWLQFSRIIYRTLMQVKLDLAKQHSLPEREFDFTVAFAIAGHHHIGCFQVGDGAIVLRQNHTCLTAFLPDKGEFANQTQFLREHGEERGHFQAQLFPAADNAGIAITSDGPEHLMFTLTNMTPGPIFDTLFDRLQNAELIQQDIRDYLTRREWNNDPRGTDDRSLAIMVPSTNITSANSISPAKPSASVAAAKQTANGGAPASSQTAPNAPAHPHTDTPIFTPADKPADAAQQTAADTNQQPDSATDAPKADSAPDNHHFSDLSAIIVRCRRTGGLIKRFSVLELLTTLILLYNTWLLIEHRHRPTPQPETTIPISTTAPAIPQHHLDAHTIQSEPTQAQSKTTQTKPAKPEPVQTEPAKPEPTKAEPVKPSVAATARTTQAEPAKPEPTKTEPAKPEPAQTQDEPAKPEPTQAEPVKPEPTQAEPVKPSVAATARTTQAEPAKPSVAATAKSAQTKPVKPSVAATARTTQAEPAKPEPVQTEPAKPEPTQAKAEPAKPSVAATAKSAQTEPTHAQSKPSHTAPTLTIQE